MEKLKAKIHELCEQVGKADAVSAEYKKGFFSALTRIEKFIDERQKPEEVLLDSPLGGDGHAAGGLDDLDFDY